MKFHKLIDMFSSRNADNGNQRIEFSCKSLNPATLPTLEQESMNSLGNAKIKDVADYIFFEDKLYQHIPGAPTPSNRKGSGKKAIDFIDILLITNIHDEATGNRKEIYLNPEINLGNTRKYLFDLIDIEGKQKSMPLYYKLKE
jgi:hypothetical protein